VGSYDAGILRRLRSSNSNPKIISIRSKWPELS
jgi:hypothetical protein